MKPLRFARLSIVLALAAALFLPVFATAKTFVKPVAQPAKTYPAHDDHADEKVAIAADPYDTPEKSKIFSVDFAAHDLLPVFFIVTNDGDQPISIANMEITLTTGSRSKLTPVSPDDIYRHLSNPRANTRPIPLPVPIPQKKVKGAVSPKEMEEIESARFAARAVEPHTTQSGFLFFDIGGVASPLPGASISVTGVSNSRGNELLYFEIFLDNYLNPPSKP